MNRVTLKVGTGLLKCVNAHLVQPQSETFKGQYAGYFNFQQFNKLMIMKKSKPLHQQGSLDLNDGYTGLGSKKRVRNFLAKGTFVLQETPRYNAFTKSDMYAIITQDGHVAGQLSIKRAAKEVLEN